MGRTRKSNPLDLPRNVHFKHGAFYWVAPGTRSWLPLGKDIAVAREEGRRRNGDAPGVIHGSIQYYGDRFLLHCAERVKARTLSPRTRDDYAASAVEINDVFGDMHPTALTANHVSTFLEDEAMAGRAVRANRDRSYLSAMFSWMLRKAECPGLELNPCLKSAGVQRNPESKRDRYVTDHEYSTISARAPQMVRDAMALEYFTLQRPGDILRLTRANVVPHNGRRVLMLTQSKTGKTVRISLEGELEVIIDRLIAQADLRTLLYARRGKNRGKAYTENSISGMIRKYCNPRHGEKIASFGLQDLKAKGATDMYQRGVPLEQIQVLCGHASVTTTEIYVKRHLTQVAAPNRLALPA